MRAVTKIVFLDDEGEKFFGEGPFRLLCAIEETGSLRAAALSMNMAYTKALKMLNNAEKAIGEPLTSRTVGGKTGGGSRLTKEGKEWMARYEAYRNACIEANGKLYEKFFETERKTYNIGCVIMASGLGKRFGGNKLMADFMGKPMITYILDAVEGLCSKCVVVTRHKDVAQLAKERNIDVVFHDMPYRSDTVRLGVEALGDMDGYMFCPGDQPLLSRETLEALINRASGQNDKIWRTRCAEVAGTPVIFPNWCKEELQNLPEGKGGSFILQKYPEDVMTMEVDDSYELMDADTPETMEILLKHYLNIAKEK